MIKVILLLILTVVAVTALPYQSVAMMDDGSYQFFYETGEDAGNQMRSETRGSDGIVVGKYGYQDPTGEQRVVNYRAGDFGYVAKGDVSVPGAPQSQLPPEPEPEPWTTDRNEHTGNQDKTEEKGTSEEKHEEKKEDQPHHEETKASEDAEEEEDEDDVKPMKIQEPSEDAPPDGFPVGFFTHQFHNLRRLPEPETKEVEEQDKKVKKEEPGEPSKDDAAKKAGAIPQHHASHLASYTHPAWAGPLSYVPGVHQPVYVYSYAHPQAHGYYYFY